MVRAGCTCKREAHSAQGGIPPCLLLASQRLLHERLVNHMQPEVELQAAMLPLVTRPISALRRKQACVSSSPVDEAQRQHATPHQAHINRQERRQQPLVGFRVGTTGTRPLPWCAWPLRACRLVGGGLTCGPQEWLDSSVVQSTMI